MLRDLPRAPAPRSTKMQASATQVAQDGDQKTKKEQDKKADLVTVYILDAAGKG